MTELCFHPFMLASFTAPATINLLIQIVMGILLLAGMWLARRKQFRAHGICQSVVMLLNLVVIAMYMLPVFRRSVWPKFPGDVWSSSFYALPAAHAIVGTLAQLLGLYIVIAAGTKLLPLANYKLWMRTTLALWWLTIALGLATFYVWNLPDTAAPVSGEAKSAVPSSVTITMKNYEFDPKELTVKPSTTVIWKNVQGKHTIKADAGGFESEVVPVNGEFSFKFEKEGRYQYFCTLHGEPGGKEMSGTIIVARAGK